VLELSVQTFDARVYVMMLMVIARGRVFVIPCEVHGGTSAWYQINSWSHSAELIFPNEVLNQCKKKKGLLGHRIIG
jgi:hypothetical protein